MYAGAMSTVDVILVAHVCLAPNLLFQVLMDDLDELFGSRHARVVALGPRVDHVLANVVLDHLGNEAIQGTPAGGGLLKYIGTVLAHLDCALNGLELTAQASDAVQKLGFLFSDVAHVSNAPV
jgi:hypothetical protein